MMIHVIATICVLGANILFQVTGIEWLITLLAIGMVLSAELINTAIEAVVDLVTLEIHPLAKIAKDCGSAATFVLAVMAAAIGCVIYIPYILGVLGL
jgi:diacylglycerol kinase